MIRNTITYTVRGNDGMRYERTTYIDHDKSLTPLGAQRLLRAQGRESAIVLRVEAVRYSN